MTECGGSNDEAECVLNALGISVSEWDMFHRDRETGINRVMQVNIPSVAVYDLNLRIPSGNEDGTDPEFWIPGGYTISYILYI